MATTSSVKIETVNYEDMPAMINEIKDLANSFNTELTTAYQNVIEMRQYWYGIRYNALAKDFNDEITELNATLKLLVGDMPYALQKIANNYSQADSNENITTATYVDPNNLVEIEMTTTESLRFMTEGVTEIRKKVELNFIHAEENMATIKEKVDSYVKEKFITSVASIAFNDKINKIDGEVTKEKLDKLLSQFSELMQQAQDDIQKAETSNTVE